MCTKGEFRYQFFIAAISRERLRRVLRKKAAAVIHLQIYIFTAHICRSTSSRLRICRSTSSRLRICRSTSSQLHIWRSTSSHLHICGSTSLQIYIFADLHLDIFTSADLLFLCLSVLLSLLSLLLSLPLSLSLSLSFSLALLFFFSWCNLKIFSFCLSLLLSLLSLLSLLLSLSLSLSLSLFFSRSSFLFLLMQSADLLFLCLSLLLSLLSLLLSLSLPLSVSFSLALLFFFSWCNLQIFSFSVYLSFSLSLSLSLFFSHSSFLFLLMQGQCRRSATKRDRRSVSWISDVQNLRKIAILKCPEQPFRTKWMLNVKNCCKIAILMRRAQPSPKKLRTSKKNLKHIFLDYDIHHHAGTLRLACAGHNMNHYFVRWFFFDELFFVFFDSSLGQLSTWPGVDQKKLTTSSSDAPSWSMTLVARNPVTWVFSMLCSRRKIHGDFTVKNMERNHYPGIYPSNMRTEPSTMMIWTWIINCLWLFLV